MTTQNRPSCILRRAAEALCCGAVTLTSGCATVGCAYLNMVHNQSSITYKVVETGLVVRAGDRAAQLSYPMRGSESVVAYHLQPLRYHATATQAYPLRTPQDREMAYQAWLRGEGQGQPGYTDGEAWYQDWVGGLIVVQHHHGYNRWGGPSWTELATNQRASSTPQIHPARFHLALRIDRDRHPTLDSQWGVCP